MRNIELLGIPGCGKTTAYDSFRKNTKEILTMGDALLKGMKKRHPCLIIKILLKFLPNNLGVPFARAVFHRHELRSGSLERFISENGDIVRFFLDKIKDVPEREFIIHNFFLMVSYYQFIKDSEISGTVLFDEGFFQRTLSIFVSEKRYGKADEVARYLSLIPDGITCIRIDSPVDACLERVEKRGHKRMGRLDRKEREEFMKNSKKTLDSINLGCINLENASGLEEFRQNLANAKQDIERGLRK